MFIPDPDLDFFYPFRIPDPGVKNIGTGNTNLATHSPINQYEAVFIF